MLKRLLSALVGSAIGVAALVVDNKIVYLVLISLFSGIGAYELIRAVKSEKHHVLTCLCVFVALGVPSVLIYLREFWMMFCLVFVMLLLVVLLAQHKTLTFVDVAVCGSAAVVIPASLSCIVSVRYLPWYADGGYFPGVFMLVNMLLSAWMCDSGAFFVGSLMGKHKLCPSISPKKTVEGLIGGVIFTGIVITAQCLVYNLLLPTEGYKMNYALIIPIGMAAGLAGVLGDLSASVIKRQYNVKDFGNLMPGHGGILDRFDSVLFTAPFIYMVYSFFSPLGG